MNPRHTTFILTVFSFGPAALAACMDQDTTVQVTAGHQASASNGPELPNVTGALTDALSTDNLPPLDTNGPVDTTGEKDTGNTGGVEPPNDTGGVEPPNDTSGSTGDGGDVPLGDDQAIAMVTAYDLTCLLLKSQNVRCWGWGPWGQHGLATTETYGDNETPDKLPTVKVGAPVKQIVAGEHFACMLLDNGNGDVRCMGRGTYGVLGTGSLATIGDDEHPESAPVVQLGWPAVEIAAGNNHVCARNALGRMRCWGAADEGQLGYGNKKNIGDDELPSAAGDVPVGGPVARIFAGGFTTCAILESGVERCWGRGGTHGNGTATIGDDEPASSAPDLQLPWPVEEFSSGQAHTCARASLKDGGEVRCFGNPALYPNGFGQGQLGTGSLTPIWYAADAKPVALEWPAAQISTYSFHTCARSQPGKVKCWGTGWWGRLGYAAQQHVGDDETPADVGDVLLGFDVEQVSAGQHHTCSLRAGGHLRCWGWNGQGGLGIGGTDIIGDNEEPFFGPDTPYLPQ